MRNMHGALLESRRLADGADLERAFIAAMLQRIDAGWRIAEFSSTGGTFFCTCGVERRMVSITATDPGRRPAFGAAHLTESPWHDD